MGTGIRFWSKKRRYQKMSGRKWFCCGLFWWELKKLCAIRALHLFVLLCIGFNTLLVTGSVYGEDKIACVRQVRDLAGSRMGADFSRQAARLKDSEQKVWLLQQTQGARDLLDGYDAGRTAQQIIGQYRVKGWVADALKRKYQRQENRIRALARRGASMDVGAAGMTTVLFDALFAKLCRVILAEGMLVAVLTALYLCHKEHMERTWQIVYTTKHGRQIQREKSCAGLLYAVAAYGFQAVVSCLIFANAWQLGGIWDTDMATQFYNFYAMGRKLPFVPWADFQMRSYLAAVLTLGLALVVVFYMLGNVAGLLVNNGYAAFLILLVLAALRFETALLAGNAGNWAIYEVVLWSPVMLWWLQPLWFSDMGIHAVIPWQECVAGALCILLCGLLLALGYRHFYRKDLA